MALIGLLPESVEEYDEWAEEKEIEHPFPLPYVCFFLGYAVVLLLDRVFAHAFVERFKKRFMKKENKVTGDNAKLDKNESNTERKGIFKPTEGCENPVCVADAVIVSVSNVEENGP